MADSPVEPPAIISAARIVLNDSKTTQNILLLRAGNDKQQRTELRRLMQNREHLENLVHALQHALGTWPADDLEAEWDGVDLDDDAWAA